MKKIFRICSTLALALLYSFAIGLYSHAPLVDNFAYLQSNPDVEQYISLVSTNLFCHTTKTESQISFQAKLPPISPKKPVAEFLTCIKATEHLLLNEFSQYSFFSQNLLVRLQKTILIFPFHYFW
ncbi:MAG: hypothetical protein H3C41_07035 [Bacteroidales bacterium]|nr:hypothetical protein [Bacteroidales bacterium]